MFLNLFLYETELKFLYQIFWKSKTRIGKTFTILYCQPLYDHSHLFDSDWHLFCIRMELICQMHLYMLYIFTRMHNKFLSNVPRSDYLHVRAYNICNTIV